MGKFERAKEVNRAACKICTDTKDLESQYEKFQKGKENHGRCGEAPKREFKETTTTIVMRMSSNKRFNENNDHILHSMGM